MTSKKNQHVVPHPRGWAVKGENNSKVTKVTKLKVDAEKIAIRIARNQKSDTKIHRIDGKMVVFQKVC